MYRKGWKFVPERVPEFKVEPAHWEWVPWCVQKSTFGGLTEDERKEKELHKKNSAQGGILFKNLMISRPGIERLNMTRCRIWRWIEYYMYIGVYSGKIECILTPSSQPTTVLQPELQPTSQYDRHSEKVQ